MEQFYGIGYIKAYRVRGGISIRKFLDESYKLVDGQILNEMTNKIVIVKAEPTHKMKDIIQKLLTPH